MIRYVTINDKPTPLAITQGALFAFARTMKITLKEAMNLIDRLVSLEVTPDVIEAFLLAVFREGHKLAGISADHIDEAWVGNVISNEGFTAIAAEITDSTHVDLTPGDESGTTSDEKKTN